MCKNIFLLQFYFIFFNFPNTFFILFYKSDLFIAFQLITILIFAFILNTEIIFT
jgi:hypothetical protein